MYPVRNVGMGQNIRPRGIFREGPVGSVVLQIITVIKKWRSFPTFLLECGVVVLAFFLEPTILEEEAAGSGDFDLGLLGDGGIGGRSTMGALEEQ